MKKREKINLTELILYTFTLYIYKLLFKTMNSSIFSFLLLFYIKLSLNYYRQRFHAIWNIIIFLIQHLMKHHTHYE